MERAQLKKLLGVLDGADTGGYTVLFGAAGSGDRGPRRADDVTETDENCVVVVAAQDTAAADRIVEAVRPLLTRFGGMCLVSDAHWVVH